MKIKTILILSALFITASISAQDSPAKFRETADNVYSTFNKGNLEALSNYFEASYNEHNLLPGSTKTGVEGLREAITAYRTAFPDINFSIVDWTYDGKSKGAILTRMTGTNTGSFMGMPPTNKKVDIMGVDYVTLNSDGKVIEHWGFEEDMKMMQQLGMSK